MKTETDIEKFERIADEHGIPRKHIPAAMKGHNSNRVGGIAADKLKSIIERIESLEQQKADIASDIREVFTETKAEGFDVKAIKKIIKIRKMDSQKREEEETILDVYMNALGMLPLFDDGDNA